MLKKMSKYLRNERGDVSTVGKIVIACIVIVFLVGVTKFVLDWANKKVETTTKTVDTEFNTWNKAEPGK